MPNNVLKLNKSTNIKDAITLLDGNGNGILPVINEKGQFQGIITDGDIRKAIIADNLSLDNIINVEPKTLNIKTTNHQRIQYLKGIKRRQLPLVDDNNNYIRMFTLDEVEFKVETNWVVIMAGGLGTRLGELTKDTPKPMLKVKGKPILEHIIDSFVEQGFRNFYISVNYKKEVIKEYFKDGTKHNINIRYLEENTRLGTAGALSLIEETLTSPLIVINGDVLSAIDYKDMLQFHKKHNSKATMCVKEYEHIVPYGVIETEEHKIIGLKEKPRILFNINSGIYVVAPSSLDLIPSDTFYDMPSLFNDLTKDKLTVTAYKTEGYWADLGRPDDLKQANEK